MTCPRSSRDVYLRLEEAADDDEHVASCPSCQEARRVVGRLRVAAPSTGASFRPPVGWQARILAELGGAEKPLPPAARSPARWWLAAPVLVAAAAAVVLVVCRGAGSSRPDLRADLAIDLSIGPRAVPERAASASVGDLVGVRAHGAAGPAALWVFRNGEELVLRCPGDPSCAGGGGQIEAELRVERPGTYQILVAGPAAALPAPAATLDSSIRALGIAGARHHMAEFEVF